MRTVCRRIPRGQVILSPMSLTVEITEQVLSRERQAVLSDLLVRTAGMEPDEAALTALVMPCAIGPMPSAEAQRSLLAALQQAGFSARAGTGDSMPDYAAPAPPPAYPAAAPAYVPQPAAYPTPGPYVPAAASPYAPTPAPATSSNTAIIAVAAVLGVAVIALAAVLWMRSDDTPRTTPAVSTTDTPPGYGSTPIAGGETADTMASDDYVEPVRSDGADYALGYSPNQGVNWGLFSQGAQTRYAAAPNGTPIPVRDAPSGRHGTAVADVPSGGAVSTDGCLPPRPEDGARWCRTDYAGGEGWIYDRFLRASAPAPRASSGGSGGVQTGTLSDGQTTMTVSDGGRTYRLPRPLSANTSVSDIQRKTLAGRPVVQFTARDARWTTTYYWEYRAGLLHFVGTDGSRTNVSEAPGSQAIISADQGVIPGDDIVRGSGNASRAPTRRAPSRGSMADVPNIIVLGSYQPSDRAGLEARLAQARQTGLPLQTVSSESYGMSPGLTVIVAGPYSRDEALRRLEQVRRYVPDAFRKALD